MSGVSENWTCRCCGAQGTASAAAAGQVVFCPACHACHLDLRASEPRDLVGKTVGGYEVGEIWQRGELGDFHYGSRLSDGKAVVLFIFGTEQARDDELTAAFKKRMMALKPVAHEQTAAVLSVGEEEGIPYCAWEYVAGESIAGRLARERIVPPALARLIGMLAAAGVGAFHDAGLVLGGLHPGQLVQCAGTVVKITGAGLQGLLVGFPRRFLTTAQPADWEFLFSAPETLARGEMTPRSDVYNLGANLFTMLCGFTPFQAEGPAVLIRKHTEERAPAPRFFEPSVPGALSDVVKRALSIDPAERYENAGAMCKALEALGMLVDAAPIPASPSPQPAPAVAPSSEPITVAEDASSTGAGTAPLDLAPQVQAVESGPEDGGQAPPVEAPAGEAALPFIPPPPPTQGPGEPAEVSPFLIPPPPPPPPEAVSQEGAAQVYEGDGGVISTYPAEPEFAAPIADQAYPVVARPSRKRLIGLIVLSSLLVLGVIGLVIVRWYREYREKTRPRREMLACLPGQILYMQGETVVRRRDNAQMVYVPSGEFQMGVKGGKDNSPQQPVMLDGYFIDMFEVTNRQYRAFCKATGRPDPILRDVLVGTRTYPQWSCFADMRFNLPEQPVVGVSWEDAQAYAQWVGGTLPSEAQWEKAARGLLGQAYPWGNDWRTGACNSGAAGDGYPFTARVGSFAADRSPFGCYDMAGNVAEWCYDWYQEETYRMRQPGASNPWGPASGTLRCYRGASWAEEDAANCRVYRRFSEVPTYRSPMLGFRVVVLGVKRTQP